MSQELKITENELKSLQEQEQKKGAILHDLGLLETQKHDLLHFYSEIVTQQNLEKKELEEKYGKVNVNLNDGSYKLIEE
tara:strand:+ start:805 stop:1041 length:237 start_codon:yes stop_codon:yes gene_type:complete